MQRAGVAGNENLRPLQHREKQWQFRHQRQNRRGGRDLFQSIRQGAFACRRRAVVKTTGKPAAAASLVKFRPMPASAIGFFGWLDAIWQRMARSAEAISPPLSQRRITSDFRFKRARTRCRQRGKQAHHSCGLVLRFCFRRDRVRCSKISGQEIRRGRPSQAAAVRR